MSLFLFSAINNQARLKKKKTTKNLSLLGNCLRISSQLYQVKLIQAYLLLCRPQHVVPASGSNVAAVAPTITSTFHPTGNGKEKERICSMYVKNLI